MEIDDRTCRLAGAANKLGCELEVFLGDEVGTRDSLLPQDVLDNGPVLAAYEAVSEWYDGQIPRPTVVAAMTNLREGAETCNQDDWVATATFFGRALLDAANAIYYLADRPDRFPESVEATADLASKILGEDAGKTIPMVRGGAGESVPLRSAVCSTTD